MLIILLLSFISSVWCASISKRAESFSTPKNNQDLPMMPSHSQMENRARPLRRRLRNRHNSPPHYGRNPVILDDLNVGVVNSPPYRVADRQELLNTPGNSPVNSPPGIFRNFDDERNPFFDLLDENQMADNRRRVLDLGNNGRMRTVQAQNDGVSDRLEHIMFPEDDAPPARFPKMRPQNTRRIPTPGSALNGLPRLHF